MSTPALRVAALVLFAEREHGRDFDGARVPEALFYDVHARGLLAWRSDFGWVPSAKGLAYLRRKKIFPRTDPPEIQAESTQPDACAALDEIQVY